MAYRNAVNYTKKYRHDDMSVHAIPVHRRKRRIQAGWHATRVAPANAFVLSNSILNRDLLDFMACIGFTEVAAAVHPPLVKLDAVSSFVKSTNI